METGPVGAGISPGMSPGSSPAVRVLPPAVEALGLVVGVLAVSTSSILVRVAEAPSLSLAFWRSALGAAALAPFALRARRGQPRLTRDQLRLLGCSGLLLALHFAAFISSLSFTTVASAAVLVTMAPLFVGLGAAVFLREPPTRRTWVGIALAGVGAAVVGAADLTAGAFAGRALLGDGLAFAGAALAAGYLLLGRALRRQLPVAVYATAVYGVAAAVLLVACLGTGAALGGYPTGTWLAIAGLVVGPQLLGHTVFNTLLSTLSATVVAVAILAEPVGSTLLAAVILGELPAGLFWAGSPAILAGVWLAAAGGRPPVQPGVPVGEA